MGGGVPAEDPALMNIVRIVVSEEPVSWSYAAPSNLVESIERDIQKAEAAELAALRLNRQGLGFSVDQKAEAEAERSPPRSTGCSWGVRWCWRNSAWLGVCLRIRAGASTPSRG